MRFRCANRISRLPWLGMGHGLGEPQGELPIRTGVAIDKVAKRFRNVVTPYESRCSRPVLKPAKAVNYEIHRLILAAGHDRRGPACSRHTQTLPTQTQHRGI
jgi:hypothetical protein